MEAAISQNIYLPQLLQYRWVGAWDDVHSSQAMLLGAVQLLQCWWGYRLVYFYLLALQSKTQHFCCTHCNATIHQACCSAQAAFS
jgi:hypothetical protein